MATTTTTTDDSALPDGLRARLAELFPGARIERVIALGHDAGADGGESTKAAGYGRPLRVRLALPDGGVREVVFHTARPDDFGHDRRSDRAQAMLLAWDTFARIPRHVPAIDVGAIRERDGALVPLAGTGELYLLTDYSEGTLYADDLRHVAERGAAGDLDLARAETLARLLAEIHAAPGSHPAAYTRAIRDLLGHGEGIFGLVDSYPADVAGVDQTRLRRIEEACLAWRWRLRGRSERLRRTHGDFHPFNIVFGDGTEVALLDASRGCEGDPADDVACLSINYLFFGMEHRATWATGLGRLWGRFWETYLAASGDADVLAAVAPYFAWRGLVLASPVWYPHLWAADRARILDFVERVLEAERFDPAWGPEAMQ